MLPFARRFLLRHEANVQVCASAEHPPRTGHDDASDAVVDVEHGEDADELFLHDFREGIVILGTVESHEDDGCGSG